MNKLIAVIMAGNCENTIGMCIKSIADKVDEVIVLYDTTSKDDTLIELDDLSLQFATGDTYETFKSKITILHRSYEHDNNIKNANSNARNFYLDYLKKNHMDDWVIVMDADEVMSDNFYGELIKSQVKELEDINCLLVSPKMVHFQQDLGHEDATKDTHWVLHRFFKVHEELFYPEGEHPVLQSTKLGVQIGQTDKFALYHLAYCREIHYLKDRYKNHSAKSEIHTPQYLQEWYYAHLFGYYPKRDIDIHTIPKVIKDEYLIDDDFFYFQQRNLEPKHFIDVSNWKYYFNPKNMLFAGDGKGVRTYAAKTMGIDAYGFDISKYALKNALLNNERIYWEGDITKPFKYGSIDLIVAYDILEHLTEVELLLALQNIHSALRQDKHILISVPMIGDPNLYKDNTHKIFWTREQWEEAVKDAGFEIEPVPEHFQYKHQLIIGRKK